MAHLSVDPYVSAALPRRGARAHRSLRFASIFHESRKGPPEGGSLSDIMGPQEEDCFMLALRVGDGCKLAAVAREASVPASCLRPLRTCARVMLGMGGTAEDRLEACNAKLRKRHFTVLHRTRFIGTMDKQVPTSIIPFCRNIFACLGVEYQNVHSQNIGLPVTS